MQKVMRDLELGCRIHLGGLSPQIVEWLLFAFWSAFCFFSVNRQLYWRKQVIYSPIAFGAHVLQYFWSLKAIFTISPKLVCLKIAITLKIDKKHYINERRTILSLVSFSSYRWPGNSFISKGALSLPIAHLLWMPCCQLLRPAISLYQSPIIYPNLSHKIIAIFWDIP